jgi:hypothetical protein
MENIKYHITQHAAQRMAQRNLDVGDLAIVLRFGRKRNCAGAKFYFFGERDIPAGLERKLKRLVGTVIVTVGQSIITVYRHENAWRDIKRKGKRDLRLPWAAASQ